MPIKHKKRYSIGYSAINPDEPQKGSRWYIWTEHWSGWKKVLFETFVSKPLDPKLKDRLIREAKRKGVPACLLERLEKNDEHTE